MEDLFLKKFTRRDFVKKLGQLSLGIGLSLILPNWLKVRQAFAGKEKTMAKKSAAIDCLRDVLD